MRHLLEPSARQPNSTQQFGVVRRPRAANVQAKTSGGEGRSLLLVDDDILLRQRLMRVLEPLDVTVVCTSERVTALKLAREIRPHFAVIELCLKDARWFRWSGLDLLRQLRVIDRRMQVTVLTSYGSIASAVSAIQLGATNYLSKPIESEAIVDALLEKRASKWSQPQKPMSADRLRWEYIQRIFHQCEFNVSETARRLRMHRRCLQRIIAKRAPPE